MTADPLREPAEGTRSLVHQCRSPLSSRTVSHLADLLRRHLKAIRSRWRILPPVRTAVIVLAVLRHDQRLADMAGGNAVRRLHSPGDALDALLTWAGERLGTPLSVDGPAAYLGVSPRTPARRLADQLGTTPGACRRAFRVP
ncbi:MULTISPECIES: hypothetical protein [unclassified Streptomyces]|uniref:hypothetical protein n=1 Tax=unclassified Streptomyces TaxID=2593676 RepID=UPI002E7990C9|nr:hypothetical protein [Streptomyces sp. JV176]MEE1802121.1 hypothetical protein [Streptomyces sp. JV176]